MSCKGMQRADEMVSSLQCMTCEEMKKLTLVSQAKKKIKGDWITV